MVESTVPPEVGVGVPEKETLDMCVSEMGRERYTSHTLAACEKVRFLSLRGDPQMPHKCRSAMLLSPPVLPFPVFSLQ